MSRINFKALRPYYLDAKVIPTKGKTKGFRVVVQFQLTREMQLECITHHMMFSSKEHAMELIRRIRAKWIIDFDHWVWDVSKTSAIAYMQMAPLARYKTQPFKPAGK